MAHLSRIVRSTVTAFSALALVVGLVTPAQAVTDSLLDHPVLDLSFEGNVTDAATPANPVTVKGAANYTYMDGVSAGTQALALGGSTYLDLGTSTTLQPQDLTLSFWLRPAATMSGEQVITWNKQAYNSDGWYLSSESNTSPLALSIGPASGQPYKVRVASADRSTFFPVGQWTHIVVSYDHASKNVVFYRNGEQVAGTVASAISGDATGVLGSSPTLPKTIGFNGPQYNGAYLTSALDQYRLYNGVATIADVVALYEQDSGRTIDRLAVAQSDAAALALPDQVTLAVVLAAKGSRGSDITWTSSDPDLVDTDGTVTRPAEGEPDGVVTLTAKVQFLDGPVVTRDFEVTVPAMQAAGTLEESGLTSLELSDDYLNNAAAKEHEYLLSLSSEKFLYEFYKVAGLTPTTDSGYSGWERSNATNFRGHAFGHYMSALAMSYAGSKDPETRSALLEQITAAVDGLQQVQDAYGVAHPASAGYVAAFRESALDAVQGTGTTDENVLVPWYIQHKILAGLLDIVEFAPADQAAKAKAIAEKFGEYVYRRMSALADKSQLLGTEYGGMNESLYELFDVSGGNVHFKIAAEAFDEVSLFRQVAGGTDVLPGRHANTTIPKFIGALKRYTVFSQNPQYYAMLTDQEKADLPMYFTAATNFFDIVALHHTYATGSNSQSEHFHESDALYKYAQQMGISGNAITAETCNEYNMLRLARELLRLTKNVKYANYYENTFINTILASQNPETGMTTYFQPMGPGYEKVFGLPFTEFWCCIGTGMENFSKLGDSMYFISGKNIYVTMFFSSTFSHQGTNLRLSQQASMPRSDTAQFTVDSIDGAAVAAGTTLRLRVPDWILGAPVVTRNGTIIDPAISGGFVIIPDVVKGDVISYRTPMKVQAIATPDNANFVAFKYGPTVLSAGLGTRNIGTSDPQGILVRISRFDADAQTSITVKGGVEQWKAGVAGNVVRVADVNGDVAFKLQNTADGGDLVYTPHYKRYNERYGLYMTLDEPDSQASQDRIEQAKVQTRTGEVSVDALTNFDNNNAEAEKSVQSSNSTVGTYGGRQYRDARGPSGWFSFDLQIDPSVAHNYLSATYYSGDNGRSFDVYVNDEKLESTTITNAAGTNVFYDKVTEIPSKWLTLDSNTRYRKDSSGNFVLDAAGHKIPVVTVRWQSTGGFAGGLFGVHILRTISYDTDARLAALSFTAGTLRPAFTPDTKDYTLSVPPGTTSLDLDADPHTASGLVYVNGILIDDTQPRTVALAADGTAAITVKSYAQDHSTSTTYTVAVQTEVPDTAAPITTAALSPSTPSGSAGWWTGPITLTLSATDDTAVASTAYALADGLWHPYTGPVPVEQDGAYAIQFSSTDAAGNVESPKSVELKLDTEAPQVAANLEGGDPVAISLVASDDTSGVATREYRVDAGGWQTYTGAVSVARTQTAQQVSFRATDRAGNVSTARSLTVPARPTELATSQTTLTVSPSTTTYGSRVVANVSVTSSPSVAGGLFSVYDGTALLAAGVLRNGKGAVTLSDLAVGTHRLTARFTGTATVAGSESVARTVTVAKATSAVALKASSVGQSYGTTKPIRLTATVVLSSGQAAAGQVRLRDGGTVLGTVPVISGKATLSVSQTLKVGRHVVTAQFLPSDPGTTTGSTSTSVALSVTKAASATTLKANRTSQRKGGPVTLAAKVTVTTGATPVGSVRFVVDGRTLRTVAVSGGAARTTWTATAAGRHAVKAVFVPRSTATVTGSTGGPLTLTVTR